jgi:hypothetical protein
VTGHLALAVVAAGLIFCLGWAAGLMWHRAGERIEVSMRGPQAHGQPPRTVHELLEDAFDQAERHGREPEVLP